MTEEFDRQFGERETGEILPAERQPRSGGQLVVPLASPNCAQVWGALAIAQGGFAPPKRTKEASVEGETKEGKRYSYKYKYAPLEEIERAIRAPLAQNGLFRQQYLVSREGQWFIRTMIGHSSGEWIACDYPIFVSKQGAQGFASGVTYARRYGLSLALGLCPEDDDDAQIADSAPAPVAAKPPPATQTSVHTPKADLDAFAAEAPQPPAFAGAGLADAEFLALATDAALAGVESFRAWWKKLTKANKDLLRPKLKQLQKAAEEADARYPRPEPLSHERKDTQADGPNPATHGDSAEPAGDDDPLARYGGGSTSTAARPRSSAADSDIGEIQLASSGDGAEGGGASDIAGEPAPRDPFWDQPKLYQAPVTIGDRTDWDGTRALLLSRVAHAADSAELMRFAADSRPTIDGVRLALKSTVIQTAITERLGELPQ